MKLSQQFVNRTLIKLRWQVYKSVFKLTERQAQAILDMRLRRLTGLERDKIESEYNELLEYIKRVRRDFS